MSSFTTDLKIRLLDYSAFQLDIKAGIHLDSKLYDGEHWQLLEEFDYCVGSKESLEIIHIPLGFITDFASVPKIFWNILPPTGSYGKAAVVHDYLYSVLGDPPIAFMTGEYTRKECDMILKEAMVVLNCSWLCRTVVYNGVRVGGWVAWNNYKRKLEKK